MKTIKYLNSTEGRQTTEMIEGNWTSLEKPKQGYKALKSHLDKEELNEEDRWFDVEENEQGKRFATTGTTDLDYYIEL